MSHFDDDEAAKTFDFTDQSVRKGFVKKVYSILMVQLIITFGFVSIFAFVDKVREFGQRNTYIVWIAFAVTLVAMIFMACCEKIRRQTPMNYIFLFIFTIAESFLLGILCSLVEPSAVSIPYFI